MSISAYVWSNFYYFRVRHRFAGMLSHPDSLVVPRSHLRAGLALDVLREQFFDGGDVARRVRAAQTMRSARLQQVHHLLFIAHGTQAPMSAMLINIYSCQQRTDVINYSVR